MAVAASKRRFTRQFQRLTGGASADNLIGD
jgi:hypothetical protein